MQVLLVLHDANGVVTRQELIDTCWRGLIVGDDAISRIISRIRRLSEGVARGGFSVETISKVGYRLHLTSDIDDDQQVARPRQPAVRSAVRFALPALALVIAAAFAVFGATGGGGQRVVGDRQDAITVSGVSGDPAHDPEMRGRAALYDGSTEQLRLSISYLTDATTQSPSNASAWGALAIAYARAHKELPLPVYEQSMKIRAQRAAARALALDPGNGDALGALTSLEPTHGNWLRKDAMLRRAMLASDESPAVLVQRARFLAHVGRTAEALAIADRAAELHPLVPWVQRGRMTLLAAAGRWEEAEQVAARSSELWSRDHGLWHDQFFLHAFHGRLGMAQDMLAKAAEQPDATSPRPSSILGPTLAALQTKDAVATDALVDSLQRNIAMGRTHPVHAIRIAAALGSLDEAMAMAELVYLGSTGDRIGEHNVAALFVPPGDRLWSHPRFMPLIEKMGLVDYWRRTRPPDFCRDPSMTAACARYRLAPQ
jgi:tetratricopeptide (TPR) repeat protein